MCVHELIVTELFERKSLAALIFLIDCGRELEFRINVKDYFISCCNSKKYVSLWCNKYEQSFDSVYELLENAKIENIDFCVAWADAELMFLL